MKTNTLTDFVTRTRVTTIQAGTTILFLAAIGMATVVSTAQAGLVFNFGDGTLQGWTLVGTQHNQVFGPSTGGASSMSPQSGSHYVIGLPETARDNAHATNWLRSPAFQLDGSGDLTLYLGGGQGASALPGNVADVPANSASGGALGVALRDAATGDLVLTARRSGNGASWQLQTLTAAQLAPFVGGGMYTLDLIDYYHGGWGWTAMDTVTVPGALAGATWTGATSSDWGEGSNWNPAGVPAPGGLNPIFGAAGAQPNVDLGSSNRTATALGFRSDVGTTIASSGGHTLTPGSYVDVSGTHTVSAPMLLDSNVTIAVNAAGDQLTIAGTIADNDQGRSLRKIGGGQLVLAAANTYSGTTTVSDGTLRLADGLALQNSTLASGGIEFDATVSGNAFTLGGLSGSGSIALENTDNNAIALSVGNNNQNTVFSGELTGAGSLNKTGTGELTLSGNNTYSGSTTISDGTLRIGAGGTSGSLGSGNVVNNGVLVFNRSDAITVGNAITGTGSVVKDGSNEVILSGSNDYSGGTTVTGGLLRATDNTIGSGGLTLQGGGIFFNVSGGGGGVTPDNSFQNAVTLGAGGGRFRAGWGAMTLSGQISGPGSFTIVNDNAITLTDTGNSYEGDTIIGASGSGNNATLRLGEAEVIPHGAGNGNLVFNPSSGGTATLDLNGHTETVNALISGGAGASHITGAGTLRFGANDADGTFAGTITGAPNLVKIGAGTQTLTGANTYTGATTIDAGTLKLEGGDNRLPAGTNVALANTAGATLDLGGTNQTIRWLTGGGATGGSLVNSGGSTSTLTLNLLDSGSRNFAGTIDGDIRVVIQDSSGKNSHVQTFSGNNTYTGGTVIDNGHLRVANDAYLGAVPGSVDPQNIVLRNGGVLQNNNSFTVLHANRGVFLESGDGVVYAGWNKDVTLNGPISGSGRLVKSDSGKLFLGAAGSHSGDTVFAWAPGTGGAGTLVLNHGNALAQSTFDATGIGGVTGTLDLNHQNVVLGGLKGAGANITNFTGQLSVGNNHQSTTYSGTLGGSGSLAKIGDGTLTLTGNSTYTGATTISGGTLMVNGTHAGGGLYTVRDGGTLGGTGIVGAMVSIDAGGTHAPGASVGEQTLGDAVWNPGGAFEFEVNDALGTAGGPAGWDLATISTDYGAGTLDIRNLTAGSFQIDILSLTDLTAGPIANFNPTVPNTWEFVTYDSLLGEFDPELFVLDDTDFRAHNTMGKGRFTILETDGGLAIGFIPEPGTLMLLAFGVLGLLVRRRRRA